MNHLPDMTPEELHTLVTGMDVETLQRFLTTLYENAYEKGRWVEALRRTRPPWQEDPRLSDRQRRIMAWMEQKIMPWMSGEYTDSDDADVLSTWFKQDYILLQLRMQEEDVSPEQRNRAEKLLRDKLRSMGMADAVDGVAAEMGWAKPTAAKDEFARLVEYGYLFSNPGKTIGGYKHSWTYYTMDATEKELFGDREGDARLAALEKAWKQAIRSSCSSPKIGSIALPQRKKNGNAS